MVGEQDEVEIERLSLCFGRFAAEQHVQEIGRVPPFGVGLDWRQPFAQAVNHRHRGRNLPHQPQRLGRQLLQLHV